MDYTLDNFHIEILNEDAYWDYKSACKITQGIRMDRGDYCMDHFYKDCTQDAAYNKERCINCNCSMNIGHIPSDWHKYWRKQLIAMHSTIRMIHFTITDMIPRSVAMQLVRHTSFSPQPYVQSSRPDWTGKPRSSDPHEPKWCKFIYTPESFLWMTHKRLCMRTEDNTRHIVEKWVDYLRKYDQSPASESCKTLSDMALIMEMGNLAVPNCEVNGLNKCVELFPCGQYEHA